MNPHFLPDIRKTFALHPPERGSISREPDAVKVARPDLKTGRPGDRRSSLTTTLQKHTVVCQYLLV
jgi:hypothetical protein